MTQVHNNPPLGTPTWIDLAVPDLDRAKSFYGTVFGWDFTTDQRGTVCLLRGRPVAGLQQATPSGTGWDVHLATDDCAATARRVSAEGGTVIDAPHEVGDLGLAAFALDPTGARFGLWQGRAELGCALVNEPDTLVRNDLVTPKATEARVFYTAVFGFTLDGNDDLPEFDFTFLRRPDGHEIGGIMGMTDVPASAWATVFEVADTDATVAKVTAVGGTSAAPEDTVYGRSAIVTDPFGSEFSVIARP